MSFSVEVIFFFQRMREGDLPSLDEQRSHSSTTEEFNFNHMKEPSVFVPVGCTRFK